MGSVPDECILPAGRAMGARSRCAPGTQPRWRTKILVLSEIPAVVMPIDACTALSYWVGLWGRGSLWRSIEVTFRLVFSVAQVIADVDLERCEVVRETPVMASLRPLVEVRAYPIL